MKHGDHCRCVAIIKHPQSPQIILTNKIVSSPDDVMAHAVQTHPKNEEYNLHKMKSSPMLIPHAIQTQPTNEQYGLHNMKSAPLLLLFFQKHKNQKRQKREYA